MNHLGDIEQIHGGEIEPVDVITFGSPCQDLSVAGKGEGLAGERSGLFHAAIRVIREMWEATDGKYPAFVVWENVPGAFSSNKGEDFRCVLEELAQTVDKNADVPEPPNGKWRPAGAVLGDGWSIAWRVFDAQFWGVPQRRRRIAAVLHLRGHAAPEVLFEREGMRGNFAPGGETREGTAITAAAGVGSAIPILEPGKRTGKSTNDSRCGIGIGADGDPMFTLQASAQHGVFCLQGNMVDRETAQNGSGITDGPAFSLTSADRHAVCVPQVATDQRKDTHVFDARGNGNGYVAPTMVGNHNYSLGDYTALAVLPFDTTQITSPQNGNNPQYGDPCHPLCATAHTPSVVCMATDFMVRRLTPLECERLQDFPDGWTDIPDYTDDKGRVRATSDSQRYKALGNSIALPNWRWVMGRIATYLPAGATLGSLFDGIGGFPLIWEELQGRGAARWASEIEPFCIAVTKYHFPEG